MILNTLLMEELLILTDFKYNQKAQKYKLSIHTSIFIRLSVTGSRGQQSL